MTANLKKKGTRIHLYQDKHLKFKFVGSGLKKTICTY